MDTLAILADAAKTGDVAARAAFTDCVKEAAADAGQSEAGFAGFYPEMGEKPPVAHMEARLAHYGRHYFVYTPLELKGQGITSKGTFTGVSGSRKNGWNVYMVTTRAMAKLETKYRVSHEMLM